MPHPEQFIFQQSAYTMGGELHMQQGGKQESVHMAPENDFAPIENLPESAQLQAWDFFDAEKFASSDSFIFANEELTHKVDNLIGRRRPWESLVQKRSFESVWRMLKPDNKKIPAAVQRSLQRLHKPVETVHDILSLSSEDLHVLEEAGHGNEVYSVISGYLDHLAVLPHLHAVAHALDLSITNTVEPVVRRQITQYPIPADREAEIAERIENLFASTTRSSLVFHRMVSFFGFRDGIMKTAVQVGNEYGVSPTAINNRIPHIALMLRNRLLLYRSFPENSLAKTLVPEAVVLADVPLRDIQDEFDLGLQIFARELIKQQDVIRLPDMLCANLDPFDEDFQANLKLYFQRRTSRVDYTAQQQRLLQAQTEFIRERVAQGKIPNELIPGLAPEQIEFIADTPIESILPYGLANTVKRGFPWEKTQTWDGEGTFADVAMSIGEGERAVIERRLTVGRILQVDSDYYLGVRNFGKKGVDELKRQVINWAFSMIAEVKGDFSRVHSLEEYLQEKIAVYLYYPSRSLNEYNRLTKALGVLSSGDRTEAQAIVEDDIKALIWTQTKYELLQMTCDKDVRDKIAELEMRIDTARSVDTDFIEGNEEKAPLTVIKFHAVRDQDLASEAKFAQQPLAAEIIYYTRELYTARNSLSKLQSLLAA